MKWIVAGAGALLSIAGIYGLVTGASIIQVERGWATFIAGAMAVSAGVITLAIAAFMARLEQLVAAWTGAAVAGDDELREAEPEPFRPKSSFMPPVFAPVVPEKSEPVAMRDAPAFSDLPPLRVAPAREPEPEPVIAPEPAPDRESPAPLVDAPKPERPAALRDFKFVFPPVEDDKPQESAPDKAPAPVLDMPALHDEDKVEPLKPVEDRPAARFNLGWLRRNREEAAPAPARIEPEPFIAPEPAPQAEAAPEPGPEPVVEPDTVIAETVDSLIVEADIQADETVTAPPVVEPAPVAEPAKSPDPFSPDWLERALAGADEPVETERPRFVPPSQRRVQTEAAPAVETPAPVAEPMVSAEAPVEIGRYKANDVSYIMFSDGSITAETINGTFRFNSLIELKDFIERGA